MTTKAALQESFVRTDENRVGVRGCVKMGGGGVLVEMRWWHHLWHTPLSCQWGSGSEAFGILSPDLSLVVPHIPLACWVYFAAFSHRISIRGSFSACSTWQHITLCPSVQSWANESNTGIGCSEYLTDRWKWGSDVSKWMLYLKEKSTTNM